MTTTQAPGGLVGAMNAASRSVPSQHRIALGLVLFAGAITIAKKAGVEIPSYAMWFGLAIGLAGLICEMIAAGDIVKAWWTAKIGPLVGALTVWAFAFSFAMFNWMGAASENQSEKTNLHKAAYVRTISTQETRVSAKAELDRLQKRMAWMETAVNGTPVTTPEAAQAKIDNAKAHRFWAMTDGCAKTKGPQTRRYCDGYTLAQTELSLAIEKQTLAEELKSAKAAYAQADAAVTETPVQTSEERADLGLFIRAGFTEHDAEFFSGFFQIAAVAIFLSFFAGRAKLELLKEEGPRVPFHLWRKLNRAFNRAFFGREPGNTTVVERVYTDRAAGDALLRGLAAAKSDMRLGVA